MFNRPEMILSQRMLRLTAIDRLKRMRATAPNAKEAEELLRCLAVAQSKLMRKFIIHIAPEGMDEPTRINAFKTLRYWSLVQRITRHQYCIPNSVKQLYPPSQELLERHFIYFVASRPRMRDWNVPFILDYWPEILSALMWRLECKPETVLKIVQELVHHFHNFPFMSEWLFYVHMMRETGQRLNNVALQAFACQQLGERSYQAKDLATADEWYAQAFTLYKQIGDKTNQGSALYMRGYIAQQTSQFATARNYYAQSLALHRPTHRNVQSILEHSFQLEIDDENLEGTRTALSRLLPNSFGVGQARILLNFALLLRKKSYYEEARDTFALALRQADNTIIGKIYFAWGKMEHHRGHIQAGCNLCRLALLHTYPEHISIALVGKDAWERFVEIRTWLATMGCDEA